MPLTENTLNRRMWLVIATIVLIAFGLRIHMINYKQCIETDGVQYVKIAKELSEEHTLTHTFYPPGYPFFIAIASRVIPDYELAARVVSALAGALLIIPALLVCLQIYGLRTALGLSMLMAFYPPLVEYSTTVSTEALFSLFFMWFAYASLRALRTDKTLHFLFAGACVGMMYLIRPEGIGFFPYLAAAYLIRYVTVDAVTTREFVRNLLCLCTVLIIITVPYMMLIGGISGKTDHALSVWSKTVGHANIVRAHDELELDKDATKGTSLLGEFRKHPGMMAKRFFMNLHLVHKWVIPALFLPVILVLLGLFQLDFRWEEAYLYFIWLPYLAVLFMLVDARFFLAFVPMGLMIAVRGIKTISELYSERLRRGHGPVAFTTVLVLILLSIMPFTFRPIYRPDANLVYKEAGSWMKEHLASVPRIMDRKPFVAYYSTGIQLHMPIGNITEVVDQARLHHATHLVVDSIITPSVRPELSPLLSESYTSDDLQLVKVFNSHGQTLFLYELL